MLAFLAGTCSSAGIILQHEAEPLSSMMTPGLAQGILRAAVHQYHDRLRALHLLTSMLMLRKDKSQMSQTSVSPSPFPSPAAGMVPALETIDVHKSLPFERSRIEILRQITLRVQPGECIAIVGPSGSGKSTLLGIIAGLDTPTSGKVFVGGIDITHMSEGRLAAIRNQKIGMVFQAFNLIPTLTAQENVEVPLYIGKHQGKPSQRAKELLGLVGLSHRLGNKPNQLSGGEQQRVAIARALATGPAIVIMDEPTGNLDKHNGDNMLHLIRDLREQTGTTFVIATNDQTVAAAADRSIHIVDGMIAQEG